MLAGCATGEDEGFARYRWTDGCAASSADALCGAPHSGQNRGVPESFAPQFSQYIIHLVREAGVSGSGWLLLISADRFLRRMVRTITGTPIESASGKYSERDILDMLENKVERAGTPSPPGGLALLRVLYDCDDKDDQPNLSSWGET